MENMNIFYSISISYLELRDNLPSDVICRVLNRVHLEGPFASTETKNLKLWYF